MTTATEIVEIERMKLKHVPGIAEKYQLTHEEAKALLDFAHDTASMTPACIQQIIDIVIQCRDNLVPEHMTFLRMIELLRETMNMNAVQGGGRLLTIVDIIATEYEPLKLPDIEDLYPKANRAIKRAGHPAADPGQKKPWKRNKFYERGPKS